MGILIAIMVFSLLFAVIGFFVNTGNQSEDGVYPIGGPNGINTFIFLQQHPAARAIYKAAMNWNGVDSEIDSILKLGAKAVITPKFGSGMLVITDEMALAIGETGGIAYGTKGQLFVGPHKVKPYIANETVKVNVAVGEEKAEKKNKSIIGSAVAGAVIAGGVGAVVGAVAAANHNLTSAEKTTTKYEIRDSGIYITYLKFKDGNRTLFLDNVYVSSDMQINTSSASWAIVDVLNTIKQP